MIALQHWGHKAREHWKKFQPHWYRVLIKSRHREVAVRAAAERMYRELTEPKCPSSGGGPMTVERWRRMKLEREMREAEAEVRRAMPPRVNIFYAPSVEPVGLSAADTRILKIGGATLAVVILGIVAFLVLGI